MADTPPPQQPGTSEPALPTESVDPSILADHYVPTGAEVMKMRRKNTRRKFLRRTPLLLIALVIVAVIVAAFLIYRNAVLPTRDLAAPRNPTTLTFQNGAELATFADANPTTLSAADIPEAVQSSVIAVIDPSYDRREAPSVWYMTTTGAKILLGGKAELDNSLTQRLIALYYPDQRASMRQEFEKLSLTSKLAQADQKETVLIDYLNRAPFGPYATGIEQASQTYFGKSTGQIQPLEAAVLAALAGQGEDFNSGDQDSVATLIGRMNTALQALQAQGLISADEYAQMADQVPSFSSMPTSDEAGGPRELLVQMASSELIAQGFSIEEIRSGELTVTTTLDQEVQENIEAAAQSAREQAGGDADELNLAALSVKAKTGEMLGAYGGTSQQQSQNWLYQQVNAGSTFYPYSLITGLKNGFGLTSMVNGSSFVPAGTPTAVTNPSGVDLGPIDVQTALTQNADTGMVDMISRVPDGVKALTEEANNLGVLSNADWQGAGVSLAAGNGTVTVAQTAKAYATLAAGGMQAPLHLIDQVKDASGNVIFTYPEQDEQVLGQNLAALTVQALQQSTNENTTQTMSGTPVALRSAIAQNNGTPQAAWAAGFTPNVATVVMITTRSEDLGDVTDKNPTYNAQAQAEALWVNAAKQAETGQPAGTFLTPTATPTPSVAPLITESIQPSEPAQVDNVSTDAPVEPVQPVQPVEPTIEPTGQPTETIDPGETIGPDPGEFTPDPGETTFEPGEPGETENPEVPVNPGGNGDPGGQPGGNNDEYDPFNNDGF